MPFVHCPACGKPGIAFEDGKCYRCPSCAFVYFHNVATAVGGIIETDRGIVLLRRALEPAAGLFGLPGGFVDPAESAESALARECREEIGWEPKSIEFLGSFPNRYEYRGVVYNTCDLFFVVSAPGLTERDLAVDPGESSGVAIVPAERVRPEELAFESTRRAIAAYRARRAGSPAGS